MSTAQPTKAWYQQLWPWLLILGPLIVVIACVITIYIAITRGDSVVTDDYYKTGKEIHLDSSRDQQAAKQGWRAQVFITPSEHSVRVLLQSQHEAAPPNALTLRLIHPTLDAHDASISLPHQNNGVFEGKLSPTTNADHWYIELTPQDHDAWRLKGTWSPATDSMLMLDAAES